MSTTTDTDGLRILKLEADNIKRLRAVEITPRGDLVIIKGKNGAGKSSILDSIWYALSGTKNIPRVPIRRGADRATVAVSLGRERVELIVERHFTASDSKLLVRTPDGARWPSPQKMLDALLGELTFDPLAFASDDPAGQHETLRRIVPLDVDPDDLDRLNKGAYEDRTAINRDAKAKRAQADAITVTTDPPPALVDVGALKDRLADAARVNADIETRRGRREQAATEIKIKRASAAEKREEAARLIRAAEELDAEAAKLQQKLDEAGPLGEPVNVETLRAEMDQAERHNATVTAETDRRAKKAALVAEVEALESQSRELTAAMEARTREKADAIARAPMPVEGLGFADSIVTFNGLPFDQASSAEQLRVSVAIAMAMNPKLRVLRIKEGSLLDADNLALLATMAQERGYQVWIETIGTAGAVGIEISDGRVVAVDGEPVAATAGE